MADKRFSNLEALNFNTREKCSDTNKNLQKVKEEVTKITEKEEMFKEEQKRKYNKQKQKIIDTEDFTTHILIKIEESNLKNQ